MLSAHKRQKRHEARAFYGFREFALVRGADAGVLRVDDLGLARNEPAHQIHLFIVDGLEVLRAEETLIGLWHGIYVYIKSFLPGMIRVRARCPGRRRGP